MVNLYALIACEAQGVAHWIVFEIFWYFLDSLWKGKFAKIKNKEFRGGNCDFQASALSLYDHSPEIPERLCCCLVPMLGLYTHLTLDFTRITTDFSHLWVAITGFNSHLRSGAPSIVIYYPPSRIGRSASASPPTCGDIGSRCIWIDYQLLILSDLVHTYRNILTVHKSPIYG